MNACYIAKNYFEKICKIPSEVFYASELVYDELLILNKPIFIFLSQSGETADSISVIKKYKNKYKTISITNNYESTMAHLTDYHLNIYAGKEIAVASTKAYTAQVVTCIILAYKINNKKNNLK